MLKRKDHCWTLLKGKKRPKSEAIFGVLGQLDELMAALGLARVFSRKRGLKRTLLSLQEELIEIGGFLAGVGKDPSLKDKTADLEEKIGLLEDPSLKRFSRPGVNKTSAFLHLARAVCRRAEREAVGLNKKGLRPLAAYFNRLSLFLFWLAVGEER